MDKNATYVVTGCTGYVGSVLTKKLRKEGCRVVGLARSPQKAARVFSEGQPELVFGDIRKQEDVDRLFSGEGPFIVLHTAAKVTIGEGDPKEAEAITVGGTETVLSACSRFPVTKLLHISSTEVLPEDPPVDEEVRYTPCPEKMRAGYPRAKSQADALVLRAAKKGLNASILIFACVAGPGDYSMGHVSQLFCDFVRGKLPASVKAGYSVIDVRDVAEALPAVLRNAKAGESYIFGSRSYEINDLLRPAAALAKRKMPPTLPLWTAYVGLPFLSLYAKLKKRRPLYTRTALAAIKRKSDFPVQKTLREFGFSPRPLEETVEDHVRFLEEIGEIALPGAPDSPSAEKS